MSSPPRQSRLPRATGSEPGPLKPETWNRLCDFVEALERKFKSLQMKPGADIGIRSTADGFVAFLKRRPGAASSSGGPCYFGRVVSWMDGETAKTGILGGIIEAGQDQWWEEDHEISVATDREKLLWIELDVVVNTLDDGSVTLSGVKSGDKAGRVWQEGDVSAGYPDKDIPAIFPGVGVTAGAGKIILPIGKITVASGALTLERAGCGHFVVTHCPGTLSYTRRSAEAGDSSISV